jgi:hypothetical protein
VELGYARLMFLELGGGQRITLRVCVATRRR